MWPVVQFHRIRFPLLDTMFRVDLEDLIPLHTNPDNFG